MSYTRCYVLNHENDQGKHEVHRLGCLYLPRDHRVYLGEFDEGRGAIQIARNYFLEMAECSSGFKHSAISAFHHNELRKM